MSGVDEAYINRLPDIYKNILDGFWMCNPNNRPEWGVAAETLYSFLHDKHSLGEIREACQQMADGGALRQDDDNFFHPTEVGRKMIQVRQAQQEKVSVPQFVSPPV